MTELFQDVTVTLNLTEMSKENYKKTIDTLKSISDGTISTLTYSNGITDRLTDEHKEIVKNLTT